jgi:hypothetical protein
MLELPPAWEAKETPPNWDPPGLFATPGDPAWPAIGAIDGSGGKREPLPKVVPLGAVPPPGAVPKWGTPEPGLLDELLPTVPMPADPAKELELWKLGPEVGDPLEGR